MKRKRYSVEQIQAYGQSLQTMQKYIAVSEEAQTSVIRLSDTVIK